MGYLPHTSFDWDRPIGPQTVHKRLSHEEAQQYIKHLEQAWKAACEIIRKPNSQWKSKPISISMSLTSMFETLCGSP